MQPWPAYDDAAVGNRQLRSIGAQMHDHEQLMEAQSVRSDDIAAINAVLDWASMLSTSASEATPAETAVGAPFEEIASLPIPENTPRLSLTVPPCSNNSVVWTGFLYFEGICRVRTWACGAVRHFWPVSTPAVGMPVLPRHLHLTSERGRVSVTEEERAVMQSAQCTIVRFASVHVQDDIVWTSDFVKVAKEVAGVSILFDIPCGMGKLFIFALKDREKTYSTFGVSFFGAFLPNVS